jgi:hypothetical protein
MSSGRSRTTRQGIIDMRQLKAKEKEEEIFQKGRTGLHKKDIFTRDHNPMTKVLGLHETKRFLHPKGEI